VICLSAGSQDNVLRVESYVYPLAVGMMRRECSDMSIHKLLFQWALLHDIFLYIFSLVNGEVSYIW
jgi:hypothetical protein